MASVVWVKWYATVFRKDLFAEELRKAAPVALHYGATQYAVHIDGDDHYRITQMTWVPSRPAWYSFWEGPEMIEFRARWLGKYQVPITYTFSEEIAAGQTNGHKNGDDGRGEEKPTISPPGEGDAFSTKNITA